MATFPPINPSPPPPPTTPHLPRTPRWPWPTDGGGRANSILISVRNWRRNAILALTEAASGAPPEPLPAELQVDDLAVQSTADVAHAMYPSLKRSKHRNRKAKRPGAVKWHVSSLISDGVLPGSKEIKVPRTPHARTECFASSRFSRTLPDLTGITAASTMPRADVAFVPIDPTEVVLRVEVYQPTTKLSSPYEHFHFLGSQRLTELRDAITCMRDRIASGVTSKSAFFFIEGDFYSDRRDPTSIDLTRQIIAFGRSTNKRVLIEAKRQEVAEDDTDEVVVGQVEEGRMDEVVFEDLEIRLNVPYVYFHNGDCEHVVQFTELRLLHGDDVQSRGLYPLRVAQSRYRMKKCMICGIYAARWMVYGCPRATTNPGFYCEFCLPAFHHSVGGEPIDPDFRAFPFMAREPGT